MPNISVMIKPASGLCNLRCKYCFYSDEMKNRCQGSYGIMSQDTLESVIKKTLFHASGECTIVFQGGEPTLAGLAFFEQAMELQKKHNVYGVCIHNAIQTNGYALDKKWAQFFVQNHFLVGLSLDGIKKTNDAFRVNPQGEGSFHHVMETVELLNRYKVDYNVLTVVNNRTARMVPQMYAFYKKYNFKYLQFIACLDPLGEIPGQREFSLTPQLYGQFLCELFDLWYEDLKKGTQPYIRSFENYVGILCGREPESCDMRGVCGMQYVIEADGSVYPCDFYVLDEMRLGSLVTDDYDVLDAKRKKIGFIEESRKLPERCNTCRYFSLCRGGCRRNWVKTENGVGNFFCESYRMFFSHCADRLYEIAGVIMHSMC